MPFLNLRDYDANLTKRRIEMQKYNYLANVIMLSKKNFNDGYMGYTRNCVAFFYRKLIDFYISLCANRVYPNCSKCTGPNIGINSKNKQLKI